MGSGRANSHTHTGARKKQQLNTPDFLFSNGKIGVCVAPSPGKYSVKSLNCPWRVFISESLAAGVPLNEQCMMLMANQRKEMS